MNVQARPGVGGAQRLLPFEHIALVLQGGGALGAYQAGIAVSDTLPPFDIVRECRFEGGSTANVD
jgi:hypothetical protein